LIQETVEGIVADEVEEGEDAADHESLLIELREQSLSMTA
jgi:hypothetical protein